MKSVSTVQDLIDRLEEIKRKIGNLKTVVFPSNADLAIGLTHDKETKEQKVFFALYKKNPAKRTLIKHSTIQ